MKKLFAALVLLLYFVVAAFAVSVLLSAQSTPVNVTMLASGTLETPGPSATLYANPYYTCTANRYVSATGNAGNNGLTAGTPRDIVTASNYAAPAGTCINLAPGVYSTQGGIVYKQRGNRTVKDRLCRLVVYHDAVLILERSSTGRGNRVRHQTRLDGILSLHYEHGAQLGHVRRPRN